MGLIKNELIGRTIDFCIYLPCDVEINHLMKDLMGIAEEKRLSLILIAQSSGSLGTYIQGVCPQETYDVLKEEIAQGYESRIKQIVEDRLMRIIHNQTEYLLTAKK